jgi:hypothetical protein
MGGPGNLGRTSQGAFRLQAVPPPAPEMRSRSTGRDN